MFKFNIEGVKTKLLCKNSIVCWCGYKLQVLLCYCIVSINWFVSLFIGFVYRFWPFYPKMPHNREIQPHSIPKIQNERNNILHNREIKKWVDDNLQTLDGYNFLNFMIFFLITSFVYIHIMHIVYQSITIKKTQILQCNNLLVKRSSTF